MNQGWEPGDAGGPFPTSLVKCLCHLGLLEAQFEMERMQSWDSGAGVQPLGAVGRDLFSRNLPTPSFAVLSSVQVPGQRFM